MKELSEPWIELRLWRWLMASQRVWPSVAWERTEATDAVQPPLPNQGNMERVFLLHVPDFLTPNTAQRSVWWVPVVPALLPSQSPDGRA